MQLLCTTVRAQKLLLACCSLVCDRQLFLCKLNTKRIHQEDAILCIREFYYACSHVLAHSSHLAPAILLVKTLTTVCGLKKRIHMLYMNAGAFHFNFASCDFFV